MGWKETLLRYHIHDWAVIILLAVFEALLLLVIKPFKRYVDQYMLNDMMFPVKSFTVPIAALVVISFLVPLVFIVGYYIYKRDRHELHHAIIGLFFAVIVTTVVTDSLKNLTGRPRPDFFWRCFPDGIARYKPNGDVNCTGTGEQANQAYKSFPSNHASWSFAGMTYLSFYFADRITFTGHRGHVVKQVIVAIPLIAATLVGISIMNDYWHHWNDVVAGGLIGLAIASYIYRQRFPKEGSWFTHPRTGQHLHESNIPHDTDHDIENGNRREILLDNPPPSK